MNIRTAVKGISLLLRNPQQFAQYAYKLIRPMRKEYRQRFDMTLREWLLYHQNNITFNQCTWMGVSTLKNPLDAWIYQEILYRVQPDIVIEIGSYNGGSTLYLAHLLDIIGKGQIISIDIDRTHYAVKHERITAITGDSSAPETIAQVAGFCDGQKVLVIHDGNHHREYVRRELDLYAPFVSVDSYFIVEDGIMDLYRPGDGIGDFKDGPLPAIEEFLRKNTDFVVDTTCERYIITYNPKGFLLRVR